MQAVGWLKLRPPQRFDARKPLHEDPEFQALVPSTGSLLHPYSTALHSAAYASLLLGAVAGIVLTVHHISEAIDVPEVGGGASRACKLYQARPSSTPARKHTRFLESSPPDGVKTCSFDLSLGLLSLRHYTEGLMNPVHWWDLISAPSAAVDRTRPCTAHDLSFRRVRFQRNSPADRSGDTAFGQPGYYSCELHSV